MNLSQGVICCTYKKVPFYADKLVIDILVIDIFVKRSIILLMCNKAALKRRWIREGAGDRVRVSESLEDMAVDSAIFTLGYGDN